MTLAGVWDGGWRPHCCQQALGQRPVSARRVSKCLTRKQKYGADERTRTVDLLITRPRGP